MLMSASNMCINYVCVCSREKREQGLIRHSNWMYLTVQIHSLHNVYKCNDNTAKQAYVLSLTTW